ncbi:hypothetical protein TTHERM_00445950 (macronuclear) [Tetrahymena thermophila SB210]|uniref:Uncharacterized protein n=1 Tax=Tetrahymena thermophila (strain SB210) TaxID=312017 RepID=I7LWY9_TETTS|nr:hypothetical protein TTHERM_00445950 [Tetrahymena thermophila SB210]EAS03114.2 hypothetical protein TTHERM_00445950 [Tetrahymena thermophila SB210]|eukprot:XP_001023359.2 hypothetical protein TTHERM_00445950 [Tetrahymena thermophila SB210]
MASKRDLNYFEKKGLILSPPLLLTNQILPPEISQPQQHPFIKDLPKPRQQDGLIANNFNSRIDSQQQQQQQGREGIESTQILIQKALAYEKELEQRQLQILKLTSDYEKQRMQAFELEQKLVLLNEENLKFRESINQSKKLAEKSLEQEIIFKQKQNQFQSEKESMEKLLSSKQENAMLQEKLLETEQRVLLYQQEIDDLKNQLNEYDTTQTCLFEEKCQQVQNNFEREKKILKDEIEKINFEKKEMFQEFQNKLRNLEIENASLRENASQAQSVQGNLVLQLKNQIASLLEQQQLLEQQNNSVEQQLIQAQRNLIETQSQMQHENERLINEKGQLSDQVQSLNSMIRKIQQQVEDLQCERLSFQNERESLTMNLKQKTFDLENLNKIYNESQKRNEQKLETILIQHQSEIQQLIENHKIEIVLMEQKIDSSEQQKNIILEKIDNLQETLISSNKQVITEDFQENLIKTYQSLVNLISPRKDSVIIEQNSEKDEINFNIIQENNKLHQIIEEKSQEYTKLQNQYEILQEELLQLKQQTSAEDTVKRNKKLSQSDNDTTQDINISPSPLRPQAFEQDQHIRNSQDINNMSQLINDMKKQISDLEEKLNKELEDKTAMENENSKLRLSIQRYEMLGGIQSFEFHSAQNHNQIKKDENSINHNEDISENFEVSRYLQEEVSRLKGLLDGQKQEYEQQISVLKEQIVMTESFSISNISLISPHLKYQKPPHCNDILNDCIYEELNEQSQSDSNQNAANVQDSIMQNEINKTIQSRCKTLDDIQRSSEAESSDNRMYFSFQDQIMYLNGQVRKAEENLSECYDKIKYQEKLIQEQNSIIEKNCMIIQQFQDNLKESRNEFEHSESKNKLLETSVVSYQTQLQQYVEQMHKNIEQLNQYEQIIKALEQEVQTKELLLNDAHTIIGNLNQKIDNIQQLQPQQQIIIQSQSDESEKIKRARKNNDLENEENHISDLKNKIDNLNLLIEQANQDQCILKSENQILIDQNNAYLNKIVNLQENQKELVINILNSKNAEINIQCISNNDLTKELLGEDILNELIQFIEEISVQKKDVQLIIEKNNQLEKANKILKQQYEDIFKQNNSTDEQKDLIIQNLQEECSQLKSQNEEYVQEIQKLTEFVEQFEQKFNEDREQISELEKKATNLINLEKVQSDIIDQQQKRDKQLQEQCEEQLKIIADLKQKLQQNQNEKIIELTNKLADFELKLQQSEQNRIQGENLMSETSNLIDSLNNQINNYKSQIEQQQEIIMHEAQKLEDLQKEYSQLQISQKQQIESQTKIIQNLQSQIQSKEYQISPLQVAMDQIQQILQCKTKELEKCQSLISDLQNQEKQSYEIIKQQEVFLLEFQKIKKQNQLEKEQHQKLIHSLQHSLDRSQKEFSFVEQSNRSMQNKLQEVQQAYENQIMVNSQLQNSLNQVKSRQNSSNQIQDTQISENIQSSIKLNQQNELKEDFLKQDEQDIDYKKQYEELKQILEDQNYLDTLNKYAKQEIVLTRELEEAKNQKNQFQQLYEEASNQIISLNQKLNDTKLEFSIQNQKLQQIYELKCKEKSNQEEQNQSLRKLAEELQNIVNNQEKNNLFIVTENEKLNLIIQELNMKIENLEVVNQKQVADKTIQESQKIRNEQSEQTNSLRNQVKQLQSEINSIQQEKQQLNQQLERLQYQLNISSTNLNQKQSYIVTLENQIAQFNNSSKILYNSSERNEIGTQSSNLQQTSNRLQVSVVEGEMKISDLKDYFGQINQQNNQNVAFQPSCVNPKIYNLKINQCTQSLENSPNSNSQKDFCQDQFVQNENIYLSDQRKLEDIQNISSSVNSEKKKASSLMNPKDIRKSITESGMKQYKMGEGVEQKLELNNLENQF